MSYGKKTKLTVSGSAKKSIKNIEIAKTKGKNSVIIEKKSKLSQINLDYIKLVYKSIRVRRPFKRWI